MPSIYQVIQRCPHQVPSCHLNKAISIDHQLRCGASFFSLNGCHIRRSQKLIRFKLGRNWRLIYALRHSAYEPVCLISRQCFELQIKTK